MDKVRDKNQIDEIMMTFCPFYFSGKNKSKKDHLGEEELPDKKNFLKELDVNMSHSGCLEKKTECTKNRPCASKKHHNSGNSVDTLTEIFFEDNKTKKNNYYTQSKI